MRLLRGAIAHTPRNPFTEADALEFFPDGGLLIADGRVQALDDFARLRQQYPGVPVDDLRGGVLLPGMVDAHVHFPQVRIVGAMGLGLLDWLKVYTLPEEARFADAAYAREQARTFLFQLLSHGVTTALVFGAHFPEAQEVFFQEAEASGLRITSGLVISDRRLLPPLHLTPEEALEHSQALISRWHGRGRLRYAVTPRFAISASEEMLKVAQRLLESAPDLYFQTHLNETEEEVAAVHELFPWAEDYLAVYDAFGLVGPRSVFAHNVHPRDRELQRLAAAGSAVAHCPTSNGFLGSGLFPLRRHLHHGVKVCLGSDVGAGTGFGLFKEGLMAYQVQRLQKDGFLLRPAHLLYLATRAGAEALGLADQVGDFSPGKEADVVWIRPRERSPLEAALQKVADGSPDALLGPVFTLADRESIGRVYMAGEPVFAP